jgi:hypothetical protein
MESPGPAWATSRDPVSNKPPLKKKNHTVWNPVESSSEQTLVSDEVKSNVEVLKNC